MGLHPNTTREHLQALEQAGFVSSRALPSGGRGRPPLVYAACVRAAGATLDERLRAQMLDLLLASYGPDAGDEDRAEGDGDAQAETASAASLHSRPDAARQVAHLELHFEDLGFDPEVSEAPLAVHFTCCPLMNLARSDTELVCRVHEDLAHDVMSQQPGPVEIDFLQPFVRPRHCVLHLRDGAAPGEGE